MYRDLEHRRTATRARRLPAKKKPASKCSAGRPLYKVFRTATQSYLYDTATNKIAEIDDDFAAYLGYGKFSAAELRELGSLRHGGVLTPTSALPMPAAPTYEEVDRAVRTNCQQIVLELTRECNLRCRYCVYSGNQPGRRGPGKEAMPLVIALKAVDYLASHSSAAKRVAVGFFGGEPLLACNVIRQAAAHARRVLVGKELVFSMTTNGTLLTPGMMAFLAENEFTTLVSIDGPREKHDQNRVFAAAGKGTFDLIMTRMRQFKQAFPDYYRDRVRLTMCLPPGTDYPTLVQWLRENDLAVGHAGPISDDTGAFDAAYRCRPITGRTTLRAEFIEAAVSGALAEKRADANFGLHSTLFSSSMMALHRRKVPTLPQGRAIRRGMCIPGCERLFVTAYGDLFPCEKTDGRMHLRLGHIYTGVEVARAWQILREFHAFLGSACAKCWMWRLCPGCVAGASLGHAYDRAKCTRMCESLRTQMADMLKLYCSILERNHHGLDFFLERGAGISSRT